MCLNTVMTPNQITFLSALAAACWHRPCPAAARLLSFEELSQRSARGSAQRPWRLRLRYLRVVQGPGGKTLVSGSRDIQQRARLIESCFNTSSMCCFVGCSYRPPAGTSGRPHLRRRLPLHQPRRQGVGFGVGGRQHSAVGCDPRPAGRSAGRPQQSRHPPGVQP